MPKRKSLWYNPWDQFKASVEVGSYVSRKGVSYIPFAAFIESAKYSYRYHIRGVRPPRSPGLEVSGSENDADGFAIYGLVRVSGINVIPP